MKNKSKVLLSLVLSSSMLMACQNVQNSTSSSSNVGGSSVTASSTVSSTVSSTEGVNLNDAIMSAIQDLQSYVNVDDYLPEQQLELENIINEYVSKISAATSEEEINSLVREAKEKIDAIKTREEINHELAVELQAAKEAAIEELSNYVDLSLYDEDGKATIEGIINDAIANINAQEKIDNISDIVNTAKAEIDKVKTKAEKEAEALANAKSMAIEELSSYVNLDDYNEPEKVEITAIINEYLALITNATSVDQVVSLLNEAKGKVDLIKTAEELLYNNINIVNAEGGTITTSVSSAKEGEIVSINCVGNEGYHLVNSTLSVVGKTSNTRYELHNNQFVMPAEEVTISASFSNKEELKPLRLADVTNMDKNVLGWESVTDSGWDGWPGEANKVGCHVEGFGYVNNLTIHGANEGEKGFIYNIEGLDYDYFSAEVGVWHDVSCVSWATMNVYVRFLVGDSNEWSNETKFLVWAMKNPDLLTVEIPENAKKMQLMIDSGVREYENTARPMDHDIIVWGNPMLHKENISRNVNSLPLSLIAPVSATTGYDPIVPASYGIRSYPGKNFLPIINNICYRDGLITNGTGQEGNDVGFVYDISSYCVDGGFDTLEGKVGLIMDTDFGGLAEIIIKVDGEVRFSKVMGVADAAVPVRINIANAQTLELIVSHYDNAITNDCVGFCDMTLMKGSVVPVDDNTVALDKLSYTSTTFWDGVPGQILTTANASYTSGLLPNCNGQTYDSAFITHASTHDANAWYGFSFDVSEYNATKLVGKCGILDIASNRIGGTYVQKSMDFKVVVDLDNDGICETTVFSATVAQLDGTVDINADITGAYKVELLMSCGNDLTDPHGDVGMFTGMYITK